MTTPFPSPYHEAHAALEACLTLLHQQDLDRTPVFADLNLAYAWCGAIISQDPSSPPSLDHPTQRTT